MVFKLINKLNIFKGTNNQPVLLKEQILDKDNIASISIEIINIDKKRIYYCEDVFGYNEAIDILEASKSIVDYTGSKDLFVNIFIKHDTNVYYKPNISIDDLLKYNIFVKED